MRLLLPMTVALVSAGCYRGGSVSVRVDQTAYSAGDTVRVRLHNASAHTVYLAPPCSWTMKRLLIDYYGVWSGSTCPDTAPPPTPILSGQSALVFVPIRPDLEGVPGTFLISLDLRDRDGLLVHGRASESFGVAPREEGGASAERSAEAPRGHP